MTIARLSPNGPDIKLPSTPKNTYQDGAAAVTIDWSKGPNQTLFLVAGAAPCVVTSVGLPVGENAQLTLEVVQDATGGRTIAFVGGQKASGFALSAGANAKDLLSLQSNGNEHVLLVSILGKAYA